MSADDVPATPPSSSSPVTAPWPVLNLHERRVLGVLVEKAKTTPDAYPMSLNALVTGCNQKSNREPVLNLQDFEVENALGEAQHKGLTVKVIGGRVERWRHALYDAWHVNKVELAVIGELLLRGPQTEGELRTRASRMEPIDDLETLRQVLRSLSERRLVVYLTPEGRRGTTVTHGFQAPDECERLQANAGNAAVASYAPPLAGDRPAAAEAEQITDLQSELAEARAEIAALTSRLNDLQASVHVLEEQIARLKERVGD
jgi:uncharacterized protein